MAATKPLRAGAGKVLMEQLRGGTDGGKVNRGDGSGGNGVGHAALEDQVHVHQPVAHNGVAEGERQKDQREHADLHRRRRSLPGEERNHVEDRERNDRQEGAPRDPFHLLTQDRECGRAGRCARARRSRSGKTPPRSPSAPGPGSRAATRWASACRHQQHPDAQQQQSRQIDQRQNPAPLLHERLALGKGSARSAETSPAATFPPPRWTSKWSSQTGSACR